MSELRAAIRAAIDDAIEIIFWKPSPPIPATERCEIKTAWGETIQGLVNTGEMTENMVLRWHIEKFKQNHARAGQLFAGSVRVQSDHPSAFLWSVGGSPEEAAMHWLHDVGMVVLSLESHEAEEGELSQAEVHEATREALREWYGFDPKDYERSRIQVTANVMLRSVAPTQPPAEPQWVAVDSAHAKQSLKTWSVDAHQERSDQTGIRRVARGRYEVRTDRLKHYIDDRHWGKYKEIL